MKVLSDIQTEIKIIEEGRLGIASVKIDGYTVFSCKILGYDEKEAEKLLKNLVVLIVKNHISE